MSGNEPVGAGASLRRRATRALPAMIVLAAAASGLVACGDPDAARTTTTLSFDAQAGKSFAQANCLGCHGADANGTAVAPALRHLAGSTVHLQGGKTITADDAYLTESIQDPDAAVVEGYGGGKMSAAFPPGSISRDAARQLVAYVTALR